MSVFIMTWRGHRDLGLENFVYVDKMYTTREQGETDAEWRTELNKNKQKTAAGRSAAAGGAPLTRSAAATRPPYDDQSVNRTMAMVSERNLNLYTQGNISAEAFAETRDQVDAVARMRFGSPADQVELVEPTRPDFEMPAATSMFALDENYIVPTSAVAKLMGAEDGDEMSKAIASLLSAHQSGAITERQAEEVLRSIDK